ncbi:unknown protein [Waddlia chondrophila 2032/99]|uniref:Uncharacterized protein n=1 Tax=Waddlia chondrophila 2032/99 TaxID=765953 RepID=F8LDL1_9BACT|nr:unknown protein [Waddlia chondrophila 2032/99]
MQLAHELLSSGRNEIFAAHKLFGDLQKIFIDTFVLGSFRHKIPSITEIPTSYYKNIQSFFILLVKKQGQK